MKTFILLYKTRVNKNTVYTGIYEEEDSLYYYYKTVTPKETINVETMLAVMEHEGLSMLEKYHSREGVQRLCIDQDSPAIKSLFRLAQSLGHIYAR